MDFHVPRFGKNGVKALSNSEKTPVFHYVKLQNSTVNFYNK